MFRPKRSVLLADYRKTSETGVHAAAVLTRQMYVQYTMSIQMSCSVMFTVCKFQGRGITPWQIA